MKKIAVVLAAVITLFGISACKDPLDPIMNPQAAGCSSSDGKAGSRQGSFTCRKQGANPKGASSSGRAGV